MPGVQTHGLYIGISPWLLFSCTCTDKYIPSNFHYLKILALATLTFPLIAPPTAPDQPYYLLLTSPMALNLHIPPCIQNPPHPHHPPSVEKPLRISIEGPLSSVKKLLPGIEWQLKRFGPPRQPAASELAKVAFRTIYGQEIPANVVDDLVVRDEYLGWVQEDPKPWE